jgi:glycosyltransferase involved in cell wall biosynthesis
MRLACVCTDPGVPVFGRKGASVHVREVIRALVRTGARVTLLAARFDGPVPPGLESVRVVPLPAPDGPDREQSALALNAPVDAALAAAGPFDAIYQRHALWSFAPMEAARRLGIPGLLEVNAPLVEEQARHRTLLDRAGAEAAERRAFAAASAVLAVSSEVAAHVTAACPAADVHVVPNGVDTDAIHPAVPPALPRNGAVTIGFVGTLKPWHGVETLLDAFAALHARRPDTRLLIVGDGPRRETLAATARPLGGAVHLTGAVDPDRIPALLTSLDIAAAPYPALGTFYFSPLKLFEYMAAGRAIVASRIGQIESVLSCGSTGLLVPPGDAGALAAALEQLVLDPPARAVLGAAARRAAVERHTWHAVARRIRALAGGLSVGAA